MTVKFKLLRPKKSGKLRTEPVTIQVVVCNKQSRVELSTGLKVVPKFWGNGEAKLAFAEADNLNADLAAIKSRITEAWKKDRDVKGPALKAIVDRSIIGQSPTLQKKTALTWIANFIKESTLKPSTLQVYNSTYDHLTAFEQRTGAPITWESFDLNFYESFTGFLYTRVKSDNTVGKIIKTLKTWLRASFDRGIHSNVNFQKRSFKVITSEVYEIYLNETEIEQFYNAAVPAGMRESQKKFVFGCKVGLRFGDLSSLTPNHEIKLLSGTPALKVTTEKTGEPVVIALDEAAKEIWDSWSGLPPKQTNPHFNREIKLIAKEAGLTQMVEKRNTIKGKITTEWVPKWKMVKAHTCRRSFATNMYLRGIPVQTIMAITGHKTEKAFKKYIRISKDQHAEIMAGYLRTEPVMRKAN